jgi:hypothetical protein
MDSGMLGMTLSHFRQYRYRLIKFVIIESIDPLPQAVISWAVGGDRDSKKREDENLFYTQP